LRRTLTLGVLMFVMLVLTAAGALAQSGSGIAGVVKDSSGAVLPGVTVEASSPALIEKVRTVVTDGAGQYKIVNLVPGVYAVSFTLTGFNTVRREGVELTAAFTATVNGEMKVGSLQETITVSGQAPTVDVQNVTQQRVMTRDIISAVPAGMRSAAQLAVLIPGVTTNNQDVGGTDCQYPSAGGRHRSGRHTPPRYSVRLLRSQYGSYLGCGSDARTGPKGGAVAALFDGIFSAATPYARLASATSQPVGYRIR